MTPIELTRRLVVELEKRGIAATLGKEIQHGHKVSLNNQDGSSLGNVVIYVGKKGPKLVLEMSPAKKSVFEPTIDDAWRAAVEQPLEPTTTTTTNESPSDELGLVRYASQLAELANRAGRYAEHPNLSWTPLRDAIKELASHAGIAIDQSQIAGSSSVSWDYLETIAQKVAARGSQ